MTSTEHERHRASAAEIFCSTGIVIELGSASLESGCIYGFEPPGLDIFTQDAQMLFQLDTKVIVLRTDVLVHFVFLIAIE